MKFTGGKVFLIVIFILMIASVIRVYIDNTLLQITRYTIVSDKIPPTFEKFKILHLSDLHSKNFGKDGIKLVKKVNREKPDIVVMTGDMVNTTDTNFDTFIDLAEQVSGLYNTYYIVGNHEQNLPENSLKILLSKLKDVGVRVLDNEKVSIAKGKDLICLYGMWFNLRYYKDLTNEYTRDISFEIKQIRNILGPLEPNSYNILLTHNPLYFPTYSDWGADLTLSGHIHGGIIRIPFIGGLFSPEREFFPKYDGGKYEINGKILIVNRGLGNAGFGFRIFNRPELSVITLKNKSLYGQ